MDEARVSVAIDGRTLSLSNLDKVLYPQIGFTKGAVIDYYTRIAPVMLQHLSGRAITMHRFPDGPNGPSFWEKRCPSHRPPWMGTYLGPGDRRGGIQYCGFDETAALVWSANLAALELHAPMACAADLDRPTMVVFDLDPGLPADITDCCAVALEIRDVLHTVGLRAWPKTSGSKGLQLYVPLHTEVTHDHAAAFAHAVGQMLERAWPDRVLVGMAKNLRGGKVFIDWSQNSRHKTTIAPYSLRARSHPTVSTPLHWDEVATAVAGDPAELQFEAADVLARVGQLGDLFAPTLSVVQQLPTADSGPAGP